MAKGRSKIITFRVSDEECRMLRNQAESRGLSESAYLRFLLRQQPNDHPEVRSRLKELINEVNHIGININQIVRSHNSALYSQSDKDRMFAYMQRLNQSVREVGMKLGNQ